MFMKTETDLGTVTVAVAGGGEVPLPPGMTRLPPLLTWGEVEALVKFWNAGSEEWAKDMRATGNLVSVNAWEKGKRARYAAEDVVALYPRRRTE
jgi:hypothetical protein